MTKFFCGGSPINRPEEIIPHLAGGEKHWRKGRSAYELAYSWMFSVGIPETVQGVLHSSDPSRSTVLLEGHFERETEIPGRGKPSQTDLLALCEDQNGRFILAVEGKVDETLGPLVSEWDNGTPNRRTRLRGLVDILGGDPEQISDLRYQLLHRTAAALIEARNFGVGRAVMLVHSFDTNHAWFGDFQSFSKWLGVPCSAPGNLSGPNSTEGFDLCVGWCSDTPSQ